MAFDFQGIHDVESFVRFATKWLDQKSSDRYGATPMHAAAVNCPVYVVEFAQNWLGACNDIDTMMRTPLHYAAAGGNLPVIELLHKMGVELDALDHAGRTPAYHAIRGGHHDALVLLLNLGSQAGTIKTKKGRTLFMAAEKSPGATDDTTFDFIREKFPSMIFDKDELGCTAFHYALRHDDGSNVKLYHELGCVDFTARLPDGGTYFHYLVTVHNTAPMAALQACGCDIDAPRDDGDTPMHLIARRVGCSSSVENLIKLGSCAYWMRNNDGKRPKTWMWPHELARARNFLSSRSMLEHLRMADGILRLSRESSSTVRFAE